ncbi:AMIN domain-containing protein [Desulfogranum mediterraneum]|uniref:AMIN domain-containing protein n=1 Tax=Desulfogranum mediterraneum TaxID=160661 RepID=UPI001376A7AF|nr:AMIN domain-containing protein [Desulfogranum mediterraneum]
MACLCLMGLSLLAAQAMAAEEPSTQITEVSGNRDNSAIAIRISADAPPTFTSYELFNPARIVLDIAEAVLSPGLQPKLAPELGLELSTRQLSDANPAMLRFEFTLARSLPFSTRQHGNDIILTIGQGADSAAGTPTASAAPELLLNDISVTTSPGKTTVRLQANGELKEYSYDVLDSEGTTPARMYIDINNISGDSLLQEQIVGTTLTRIRVARRGSGLRLVFDSASDQLFPFTVQPVANGLEIVIDEPQEVDQVSSLISEQSSIESQLPDVDPLARRLSPQATAKQMEDAFNFSGYNKERITVDFYKIDLHNVFRLFREVSGINIVVDEGVSGSLTLALDDVPWDFALDIILNLKDLTKEERFNTLVILPKSKSFAWPKQAENNITFETNIEVAEQEALIIRQQKSLSKEVIQAKQLIAEARKAEKSENYEIAVSMYEQALVKWPENSNLANRIASTYLVRLRQNAKAAFYARKALAADPENSGAALNAAIALANMQEKKQAVEYFDQSISTDQPSREALLSYAVFSEEQEEFAGALVLLSRHDELYGQTLNSMIATARIFDKMGDHALATDKYQAILFAGFRIPPDLAKYIKTRITLKPTM